MTNLFSSGIRPAIDDHLLTLSREKRNYGEYWSASSAGYCMRKTIFERLGVPHVEADGDARKQRVFTAGHIFHDWIQGLTKAAGLSIAQEVELQDEDLMVRGHFDDLVLVGDEVLGEYTMKTTGIHTKLYESSHLILYDYKTVNSKSFTYAKANNHAMSYYHRLQLGTYMYMLRRLKGGLEGKPDFDFRLLHNLIEARILKIEKDALRMDEQQLLWDTQLESDVFNYWNELNAYWNNKKLPDCTCDAHEGGFLAREKYNPFFYEGEPCSLKYYEEWKHAAK
jgi:hypothetical protein